MRSFPKYAILALGAALGLQAAAAAPEPKKEVKKPEEIKKPGVKPKPVEPENGVNIPVPEGQPQKVVKFPVYGADGVLEMRFEVGVATKVDDVHVKLEKLRVETFKQDEKGRPQPDMDMDLPDAMLNQKTGDLTSETSVYIKCKDWEITGQNMTFNIRSRAGSLGGGVKMVIPDFNAMEKGRSDRPAVEFQISKDAKDASPNK